MLKVTHQVRQHGYDIAPTLAFTRIGSVHHSAAPGVKSDDYDCLVVIGTSQFGD